MNQLNYFQAILQIPRIPQVYLQKKTFSFKLEH